MLADAVGQILHAQHRFHARDQGGLIERLGQVFVGTRLKAGDNVLGVGLRCHQDNGDEGQLGVSLDALAHFDSVDLRHHDVEQDEVGMMVARRGDRFFAVGRLQKLIAMRPQPRAQDVAVGLVVVDDQNARRTMHGGTFGAR